MSEEYEYLPPWFWNYLFSLLILSNTVSSISMLYNQVCTYLWFLRLTDKVFPLTLWNASLSLVILFILKSFLCDLSTISGCLVLIVWMEHTLPFFYFYPSVCLYLKYFPCRSNIVGSCLFYLFWLSLTFNWNILPQYWMQFVIFYFCS